MAEARLLSAAACVPRRPASCRPASCRSAVASPPRPRLTIRPSSPIISQISSFGFVAPSTIPQRPKYKSTFAGDLAGFQSTNVNDPYEAALDDALREKWLKESLSIHPRPLMPSGRVEIAGGALPGLVCGGGDSAGRALLRAAVCAALLLCARG